MTVDELIVKLKKISEQGGGDYIVCSASLAWEMDVVKAVDEENTVYID